MLRTHVNVNPNQEIRTVEEMFDRLFGQPSRPVSSSLVLPVDIIERDGNLVVNAAVPGMDPEALDISIENNVLSIRGELSSATPYSESDKVYRREVSYGAFNRSIRLPENLDLGAVSAEFNHGMVSVTIPRVPEQKPQAFKVPVRSSSAGQSKSETPNIEAETQR